MQTFGTVIVFIGIALCVNADLTEEQKQKFLTDAKACIEETKVDADLVKQAREGKFADDPKLKEFIRCTAQRIGFQDATGKLQPEVVRQKMTGVINDAALLDKLIEKCLDNKGTPNDTAFESYKCFYENNPSHLSVI